MRAMTCFARMQSRAPLGRPWDWALLWIMAALGVLVAGASSTPARAQTAKDQIVIEVLGRASYRTYQELDLQIEYALSKRPDRLIDFAAHWRDPVEEDELVASTYLHHRYVDAGFEISSARWNDSAVMLRRLDERSYAYPKGPGRLTLRAKLKVPRGKWPLGCVRGRCAVVGALALLPASVDAQGDQAWPMALPYRIEWKGAGRPADLVVHASKQGEPIVAPSLFWGMDKGALCPRLNFWYRGVHVQIDGALAPMHRSLNNVARWPWPRHQLGHLENLAKEAIDTALAKGLRPSFGQKLSLVVGPLRAQMVQSYAGMVLVSDRYLDTMPLARFSKFHDASVVRGILDALSFSALAGAASPRELVWVPGAIGASMVPAWRERRRLRDEDMAQILSPVGFIPGVDDLLYSGQASQAGSFFRSADDDLKLRRHPMYFANQTPTGFRIYRKLSQRLGEETFAKWRSALLSKPGQDPIALAQAYSSSDLSAFFKQWLGAYPSVDYAVSGVRSWSCPEGYCHEISLRRYADGPVHEAVQLRVRSKDGEHQDLLWTPEGPGDIDDAVFVTTKGRFASVELDPEHRLQEEAREPTRSFEKDAHGDPRFNNRLPGRLRWVYTGIYFSLALSELLRAETRDAKLRTFSGYLSWEAGLKRDLRRMFTFSLSKGRSNWLAGSAGMTMQFGRKITGNRRLYALRVGAHLAWLTRAGFDAQGGIGGTWRLSLSRDTRRFSRAPQSGHRSRIALARHDDWLAPKGAGLAHRSDWSFGLSHAKYFKLAHNHVLALQGSLSASFRLSSPMFRGLVRAGGIGGLSGFGADELFGRGVAMLKAEYRHIFLDSLRFNLLGLFWVKDIGGAAFAGAAFVSDCDGIKGFEKSQNYVGQIGYGLTGRYDILGIAPQMMRIGVAIPIGRSRRECLGKVFPDALAQRQGLEATKAPQLLAPFGLNISFSHDF